jgi:hypothetical protein
MSEVQSSTLLEELGTLEELSPVVLFGTVSGGCEAGSDGWKCDVRATEET